MKIQSLALSICMLLAMFSLKSNADITVSVPINGTAEFSQGYAFSSFLYAYTDASGDYIRMACGNQDHVLHVISIDYGSTHVSDLVVSQKCDDNYLKDLGRQIQKGAGTLTISTLGRGLSRSGRIEIQN